MLHDRLATAKCKIGTKIAMTISEFLKVLSEILKNEACHVHYEKSDKADVISLENLLNSYGLSQFVQGPTHKKGHTLDLLCANKFEFDFPTIQCKSVNLSDHYPIFFNIPNNCTNVDLNMKPVSRRNIKSIDIDSFKLSMCPILNFC